MAIEINLSQLGTKLQSSQILNQVFEAWIESFMYPGAQLCDAAPHAHLLRLFAVAVKRDKLRATSYLVQRWLCPQNCLEGFIDRLP